MYVIFISTNELGIGSAELGTLLMKNFINSIADKEETPKVIIFMNSGVKLTVQESPVLEELQELQTKGVRILVCGTCLDYYVLKDYLSIGEVSNIHDITDLLLKAEKVISL